MNDQKPYADEIKALKDSLREANNAQAKDILERRHACVLYCYRKRMVWSAFRKEMVEFKTVYYLASAAQHEGYAYNSWDIRLTEDSSSAQLFTVEEAVAWSRSLPFETIVQWREDNRTRCPECDSLTDSKVSKGGALDHTCRENSEHKVPSFTLFSTPA